MSNRRDPDAAVETEYVQRVIDQLFHDSMRVTFEEVSSIPRERSGKYRVCINRYCEREEDPLPG